MNEAQKSVLQRHHRQLADDIMVTEDLYGSLFQRKVFERPMIETIKAERTPTEQVYKILDMLPKRGPEAFEAFISILQEDHPWLAAMLETSYKCLEPIPQSAPATICTCGGMRQEGQNDNLQRQPTDMAVDADIKTRVGTFVHKVFGQSKRVSQTDKKAMEKWFSEQIQIERKRVKKRIESNTTEESQPENNEQRTTSPAIPEQLPTDLKRVFNKVRDENLCDLINNTQDGSETDEKPEECDEVDGAIVSTKPEDLIAVVIKLETEVDKLINKVNELEGQITQCHYILGDHDKKHSLATVVKDTHFQNKQLEKELNKEKEKSEKMLHELYDYCKSINKLENLRQQQRMLLEKKEEENSQLKHQYLILQEKCSVLEKAHTQHLEKEQTLENLRKMVKDLQSNQNLPDENANFSRVSATGAVRVQRRSMRQTARRGSIADQNSLAGKKVIQRQPLSMPRRRPAGRLLHNNQ